MEGGLDLQFVDPKFYCFNRRASELNDTDACLSKFLSTPICLSKIAKKTKEDTCTLASDEKEQRECYIRLLPSHHGMQGLEKYRVYRKLDTEDGNEIYPGYARIVRLNGKTTFTARGYGGSSKIKRDCLPNYSKPEIVRLGKTAFDNIYITSCIDNEPFLTLEYYYLNLPWIKIPENLK